MAISIQSLCTILSRSTLLSFTATSPIRNEATRLSLLDLSVLCRSSLHIFSRLDGELLEPLDGCFYTSEFHFADAKQLQTLHTDGYKVTMKARIQVDRQLDTLKEIY